MKHIASRVAVTSIWLLASAMFAAAQTSWPASRPVMPRDSHGNSLRRADKSGHLTNYDEPKVGDYTLPDPLVLDNGQPVKDADTWFNVRRLEILKKYQNEIYGRIPDNAPKVTWSVASTDKGTMDGKANTKHVVGQIGDNGPKIRITLNIPADAKGTVPVILCINFGFEPGMGGARPGAATAPARAGPATARAGGLRGGPPPYNPGPDVIAKGYAYATLVYTDIQPDKPDSFAQGVIGMTLARGETAPAPNEWGTISAWCWGLSRCVDYFQTDPQINGKEVAIQGHSRLGKTVIWEGAQDPRIALVFSSCGGELGTSLARRDYGETVDDMAQNYGYQFAGNLQKYLGHWNDMPVDTHMVIALNAPHPVFIGGGTTDQWSDPRGEFLAEMAAGPVYKLVGKKDLGVTDLPPYDPNLPENRRWMIDVNPGPVWKFLGRPDPGMREMQIDVPLITGDLGWNYHEGPHIASQTDWKAFLDFAGKYFK